MLTVETLSGFAAVFPQYTRVTDDRQADRLPLMTKAGLCNEKNDQETQQL